MNSAPAASLTSRMFKVWPSGAPNSLGSVEKQVAILYVASKGKLDDIPTPRVSEFESGFYTFLDRERPQVLTELAKEQALTDNAAKGLDEAVDVFRKSFLA